MIVELLLNKKLNSNLYWFQVPRLYLKFEKKSVDFPISVFSSQMPNPGVETSNLASNKNWLTYVANLCIQILSYFLKYIALNSPANWKISTN